MSRACAQQWVTSSSSWDKVVLWYLIYSKAAAACLMQGHPEAVKSVLLGDCFVVGAQVAAAFQFIIEEKFLTSFQVLHTAGLHSYCSGDMLVSDKDPV